MNAETRLLLGGPRALLMQLAHPMVAAGVADHSDFTSEPFARLWNTLNLTLTIGFGDADRAAEAAAHVSRIHARVRGARPVAAYRATDPDLLAWVHATLVDTAIETYATFVGRIGAGARDRYLHEMDAQARVFGVPGDRLWQDYAAFQRYVDATVASLRVSDEGRSLGAAVLSPETPLVLRPVVRMLRLVTAGMLAPALRDSFDLGWSPARDRSLRAVAATIRAGGHLLPDVARRWPHAREADRRVG